MKNGNFVLTAVLASLLGTTSVATADTATLANSGFWQAYGGTAGSDRVCGINTSGESFYFSIKYFENSPVLEVIISKNTWNIPQGIKINSILRVDGHSPRFLSIRRMNGTGVEDPKNAQVTVGFIEIAEWPALREELAAGSRLTISFPDGNEPQWSLKLEGTRQVLNTMLACIKVMVPDNQSTTQPFSAGQSSQPYKSY